MRTKGKEKKKNIYIYIYTYKIVNYKVPNGELTNGIRYINKVYLES